MTLIYAHRGASGTHPENTLRAFREALVPGVAGIELDLHATADGVPVVIHDRDLTRTTNGTGYVDQLSLERLQALDAGAGERVPTLAETLELVGDTVHLDLEIKGHGIAPQVLGVLAAYPAARWAISSFDWDTLREVRQLASHAMLWPLAEEMSEELPRVAAELASPAVALAAAAFAAESAATLRAAGLDVMAWTVNDATEAQRVHDLGAFALCTDHPRRIIAALQPA